MEYDDVYYPESVEIGEAEIDKIKYSAHRLNKNFLMPAEPAAILFIGPRGCSKTTKMLALIEEMDWDTLSIFSTSLQQDKFQALMKTYDEKEEELGVSFEDYIMFSNDLSIIVDGSFIKSRDPSQHHLVIIDDFVVSDSIKEKAFLQLVLNGRPVGITSLISTQTFTGLDKDIRDNATHLAFFRGIPPQNIARIGRDYIGGMTKTQFQYFYNTLDPMTAIGKKIRSVYDIGDKPFIYYDKQNSNSKLTYRINFDICLNLKQLE